MGLHDTVGVQVPALATHRGQRLPVLFLLVERD